jgi:hypothetical protein
MMRMMTSFADLSANCVRIPGQEQISNIKQGEKVVLGVNKIVGQMYQPPLFIPRGRVSSTVL